MGDARPVPVRAPRARARARRITFGLALFDYDLIQSPQWAWLDNFKELIDDEIFRKALRNSLVYVAFAVPLRIMGALFLALLLHKRFRGVGTYRTSAYLPTIIPDVAYALLWLWLFNPFYGPINIFLGWIGLNPQLWLTDPNAAQAAVIIMSLFVIGEGFIVLLATRHEHPTRAVRALRGGEREAAVRLLAADAARDGADAVAPDLPRHDLQPPGELRAGPDRHRGGPPPYSTTYLPLFVYREGFEYLRYGYAAAATVIMFIATLVIVFIQWRIIRRWRHAFAV